MPSTPLESNRYAAADPTITIWHGKLSDIPSGWALCDGNNGTPDLRDRFIRGGDGVNLGQKGGANSVTLTEAQNPSHYHTGTLGTTGSHTHSQPEYTIGDIGGSSPRYSANDVVDSRTTANGSHSHSGSTDSVGSGNSIDNRPRHHEVAFIMRL